MTEHLTLSAIKARGWSPKLIEDILGAPDKTSPNPKYRSAPPAKLWLTSRVEASEADPRFVAHASKRAGMSDRSKRAADKRRLDLLAAVEKLSITVQSIPIERLRREAVCEWENRRSLRGDWDANGSDADDGTISRWMVNFVRHNLCTYDAELERVAGKVGVNEAVAAIRRKVYAKISESYPSLSEECDRQASVRGAA